MRMTKTRPEMTIAELIAELQQLDPTMLVIQSRDSEGNGYSPTVNEFSVGFYAPDSTWSGEFYSAAEDEDSFSPGPDDQAAVVLWPTN